MGNAHRMTDTTKSSFSPKAALRFVLLMGVVSLFADMTYEGGRSITGAFLGHLGANAAIVGVVAGGSELLGYGVRIFAGRLADRTGRPWLQIFIGYALNLFCVPALALAGAWPAAAGLIIGERLGRGIRRPATSALISRAGKELGSGRVFGINEALDQTGATVGPLTVAYVLFHGDNFAPAFAMLAIPAALALVFLAVAASQFGVRIAHAYTKPTGKNSFSLPYRYYVAGGALFAAGMADFALVAFHFQQTHMIPVGAIPLMYALAMVTGAIAAPLLGHLFDRYGILILACALVASAFAAPLLFLGDAQLAAIGIVLWGVGMTVGDSLVLAAISKVTHESRRGTAFGTFDSIFGVAWFIGSALMGLLYDRSPAALVAFSVIFQLLAVIVFVAGAKRHAPAA